MEITKIREIWYNAVASCVGACGHPAYFPPQKAFVAETDANESFITTVGGTEIYNVSGDIPAGAFEDKLKMYWQTSCAIPITSEMQFRECVELIIENHF